MSAPMVVDGQSWRDDYKRAQDAYAKESNDEAFTLADATLKAYLTQDGQSNDNYAAILRLLSSISFFLQRNFF